MTTKQRSAGSIQRLTNWLKGPTEAKIHSILVRLIFFAKKFDSERIRGTYFEALDPNQEFSISARGREKFVVIHADKGISKVVFVKGAFDFNKVEKAIFILRSINKNFKLDTLIDVGANIGTVCIPAVKRGIAAKAIAIEPEPLNYRVLVANVFLNDLADKIRTYNLALGNENNQSLEIELSPSNSGDHRIHVRNESAAAPAGKTTLVRSETFDSIIPAADKTSSLIWMDTQGYEGIILQGARKATRAQVPTVIEFWPSGMKTMHSYPALKDAMMDFNEYYDLSEDDPRPVKLSLSNIDVLYEKLSENDRWTDILMV